MSAAHHSAAVNTCPRPFIWLSWAQRAISLGRQVISILLVLELRNSAFGTREQATAAKTYRVKASRHARIDAVNHGGRGGGPARHGIKAW